MLESVGLLFPPPKLVHLFPPFNTEVDPIPEFLPLFFVPFLLS